MANGKQYVFLVESNDFENLFSFNCKLTISIANANEIIITNQLDEIKNMNRWEQQINENHAVLRQALVGYLIPEKAHKIEIMLYV